MVKVGVNGPDEREKGGGNAAGAVNDEACRDGALEAAQTPYVQPMEPMPINSLNGPLLPSTEARDQCGEMGTHTLKGKESPQTRLSGLLP